MRTMKIPRIVAVDDKFLGLEHEEENASAYGAELAGPNAYRESSDYLRKHGVNVGAFAPFWCRDEEFMLRPGEVSIIFGSRGSMKSTLVNYLVADVLLRSDMKVGLLSYEVPPEHIMVLLASQLANSENFTDKHFDKVHALAGDRLLLTSEMVDSPHGAIGRLNHMSRWGAGLIVLDCLQRVDMAADAMEKERRFVVALTRIAKKFGSHIIIVHHSRKGSHSDGDNPHPVIDDLKGSGGLADNCHNVGSVWANKKKKSLLMDREAGHKLDQKELDIIENECDIILGMKKQRYGRFEGGIGLYLTPARAMHRRSARVAVL